MSLKYKQCCSEQGDKEFNFSQMAFSFSLQPASVRRGQDAHSIPGCVLIHKRSIIQNFHSGDVQGTADSPLLTLEEILARPSPVPCNTLKPPLLFTSFTPVLPPVSHSSRRKEESGRISALIRNAEGEKDGRWLGGKGKEAERDGGRLEGKKLERKINSQKEICPLFV